MQVTGLTTFTGTTASDTAPLGSELAAVTGTGTNWTLAGTNLNVGGYTHTTGSAVPLTTALAAVNGTYYQITYTITGRTAGLIIIAYGGTTIGGITATGATGPLASSTAVLTITPTTDFDGTVVLSIKSIGTSSASSTFANSSGTSNIEVRASSATSNTFIGLLSGRRNTTGTNNAFIGSAAGQVNTTGGNNSFLGYNAGVSNTIGANNSFFGTYAGQLNTTGNNNTAVGYNALITNTTGAGHTALGASALQNNSTGTLNSAIGFAALRQNTTGNNNTAFGYAAMQNNTTGAANIAIGTNAGRYIANGTTDATILNNSIFIGNFAYPLADNQTNQIVIGAAAIGLGSNTTVIGNSSTTVTGLYGNLVLGGNAITGSATGSGYTLNVAAPSTNGALKVSGSTQITGSLNVSGSITTTGTITAQTLVVQTVTSSIVYSSGSNIFGNKDTDNQVFTGSVLVSGSITVSGSVINTLTASYAVSASQAISASQAVTASYVLASGVVGLNLSQIASGSVTASVDPTTGFKVNSNATISGSLTITGSSYSFNNTLNTYFITSSAPSGSNVIFSQPTGSYTSAFYKYTISSGSNTRAGEVISVWNSTTSSYTDYTTTDIGNTSPVVSLVTISGNNVVYTVSSSNGGWTIKSLVVYI